MDELKPLFTLLASGLILRFSLTLTGQNWAKSYHQTAAFLILPFVTYVITKTITGNIALSLGMIGALSIVRFRNPVRSPLELVMFFVLITVGIATTVRTKWAIQLVLVTAGIIIGMKIINIISKKFNKSFYNFSFNEETSLNMLEVHSSEKIESIENNPNLKVIIAQPDQKKFVYRLAFENKKKLQSIKKDLEKNTSIIKTDINYE